MTMYQIYNEKVYDLINFNIHGTDASTRMASQIPLKMLENEEGFQINNLFTFECRSNDEALKHFDSGVKNRIVASHSLNHTSSRSHVICQLQVDRQTIRGVQSSRIVLVDLAGSERASYLIKPSKQMQQEMIGINKSLMTLRKVINALA